MGRSVRENVMPILKEELDALSKYGVLKTEMPEVITAN
jgi:hypothetical protein